MEDLEPPNTATTTASVVPATGDHTHLSVRTTNAAGEEFVADESYYVDSNCSTPYVSAPSSPGRGSDSGYFYSAPASPMHFVLSKASLRLSGFGPSQSEASETPISGSGSFEFDFSARFAASYNDLAAAETGYMSSADELFFNGQIRPLKLSTHLQKPQVLASLADEVDSDGNDDSGKGMGEVEETDFDRNGNNVFLRSRDLRLWNKSLRRRTRSLSPLRNTTSFDWSELVVKGEDEEDRLGQRAKVMLNPQSNGDGATKGAGDEILSTETTPSASASSSRCSSAGRSSNRWVFLKDFLRSKSEGRSNHKFWTNISFSPAKEKKSSTSEHSEPVSNSKKKKKTSGSDQPPETQKQSKKSGKETAKKSPATAAGKPANGVGKRRVPLSAHELHYTANRAQAEEMRKKTYLPYRQGLLGCLGFSSKSYGAMNGLARALNPVSSR